MATIISLSDAKSWLRYANPTAASSDDADITTVINAAQRFIEMHVGITVPTLFDEYYTPNGTPKLYLRNTPVLEIVSVTEQRMGINYELDFQAADTGPTEYVTGATETPQAAASSFFAYSLDVPSVGEVTRRGAMNTPIPWFPSARGVRIIYRAGRNPIPDSIGLAARELVAHVWQNAELRSHVTSPAAVQYDAVAGVSGERPGTSQAFWVGIPKRIIGLLEADQDGKLPVIA